ncbi:MAG: hypothetical protein N3G21_08365 [Candidatus Hydrogenedentes bacterium]|nr:hypothetical protein [Candidatus Hydrogenedentota bacterium]
MADLYFQKEDETQLKYLGIFSNYYGKGIEKYFLDFSIRYAFSKTIKRLWLHTCSLDSPYALHTCLQAGLRLYKTKEEYIERPNIQATTI